MLDVQTSFSFPALPFSVISLSVSLKDKGGGSVWEACTTGAFI